jgi:hypothetical protein
MKKSKIKKLENESEIDNNESSLVDSSISFLYEKTAEVYNKGTKIYSDFSSELQFVPNTISIDNKCFDIKNNFKLCK